MKSSAWYHKLWRKKLDELPVKGNANVGWKLMEQQLNAHLPVSNAVTGGGMVKPLVSKLIALVGYVLPAAAMVGVGTYVAVSTGIKHKHVNKKIKKNEYHVHKASDSSRKVQFDIIAQDTVTAEDAKEGDTVGQIAVYNSMDSKSINSLKYQPKDISSDNNTKDAAARLNNKFINGSTSSNKLNINTAKFGSNNQVLKKNFVGVAKLSGTNYGKITNGQRSIDVANGKVDYNRRMSAMRNPDEVALFGVRQRGKPLVVYGAHTSPFVANQFSNQNDAGKYDFPKNKYISNQVIFPEEQFLDRTIAIKPKGIRSKPNKAAGSRTIIELTTPAYNYGLQAGLTTGSGSTGFYLGLTANYALTKRWLAEGSLLYNSSRTITGNFSHPSYYRPDSSAALSLADSRKVQPIDVSLNIQYRVNSLISLKAGPVLSFAGKQLNVSTRLGAVGGFRDTLRRTGTIDSVRNTTVLTNKVNVGLSTGIGVNLKHFNIEARYLWLPQYKVSNSWGNYNQPANRLQVGISYLFKSK
ncbi:outer membrane beta-barrel protein [Mucilaginibacter galii]|uniref:Outer membrane protein beta-barrel domain-containing protein n=1 Tax=Mucilaginibacter galii TaxID=2005073 RepID=A0A917N0Q5_9SPHI|nr:outer membrane beta-barrel protein [Mucilaginibacter galii]GGI50061.1 hypothetical protein GCM10011425_12730 [Mucilaginibacter galii]